jgi:predicted negative regulator of RcsB-dependent stress response
VKERVTKDDFEELKQIVRDLAQAQSRTEVRMEELAQAKTEFELRKLAKSHHQLQQQVGGLSDAVGYGIEDRQRSYKW